MTPEDIGNAIRAFRSPGCPACGSEKADVSDPFCNPCVERLPEKLRDRVSMHSTYIETFGVALSYLTNDGTEPFIPRKGDASE